MAEETYDKIKSLEATVGTQRKPYVKKWIQEAGKVTTRQKDIDISLSDLKMDSILSSKKDNDESSGLVFKLGKGYVEVELADETREGRANEKVLVFRVLGFRVGSLPVSIDGRIEHGTINVDMFNLVKLDAGFKVVDSKAKTISVFVKAAFRYWKNNFNWKYSEFFKNIKL